ncbi:hypothetical protein LshimejAT787_0110770 [Lyophyllum shimeji]|uniref:Cytochrome c oxidase assembly factor 3 n=1 Tax=Lyophyllum shimeji TaxID=47721 RepID=A0A9P3UIC1_LYOSH|nr:hypothetical protein LshimejAT787_0110770 [Lyophyllum shimeji]
MSQSSQYIDQKTVNQSYRPRAGAMSPGLQRAREPYRVKNALTGLALGAFAVGVWAYSISAVKQDVFDDVDEEARALGRAGTAPASSRDENEKRAVEAATAVADAVPGPETAQLDAVPAVVPPHESSVPAATLPGRGVLRHLDARFPRLLDPQRKTLVWGAPPVDNVGKIGRS